MRTRVYTSPVPLCAHSPPEWFLACFSSMPAPLLFCRLYPPPELKLENRGACVLPARSLPYFWPGFQEAGFKCSLLDNCTARCFHWGNILFSRLYFWMESLTHVKSRTQCLLTCRLPRLTKHSDLLRTTPVLALRVPCSRKPFSHRKTGMFGPPYVLMFQALTLFFISSHWPPANFIFMTKWQRRCNYV